MTKITIVDGTQVPHPEDNAMLMAMYSRSPAPVEEHLAKVAKVGSGKFMDQFYVGYGHESIGDLGTASVYIEGLSMAAAKAVQNNSLYRGQECSTRYIDFSRQEFYFEPRAETSGFFNANSTNIMEGWRSLYQKALPKVGQYLRTIYSEDFVLPDAVPLDKREGQYNKTITALTFDVCRGLLPIGATTSVGWAGELRNLGSHTRSLMMHPLPEVSRIGHHLYQALRERYPNSFAEFEVSEDIQADIQSYSPYYAPYLLDGFKQMFLQWDPTTYTDFVQVEDEVFTKARLPYMNNELRHSCMFTILDSIDYASYRDLQRHRPGYMSLSLPIGVEKLNENSWYAGFLQNADGFLWREAEALFSATLDHIENYSVDEDSQYFMPMMVEVPVKMKWNLHQMIYVMNLRSGVTVHPTLRHKVKEWAAQATSLLGREVFTLDQRKDYEATWRGDQSIEERSVRDAGQTN